MKNLKLTILKQPGFVGELMNVFGEAKHVRPLYGNSKFIQFNYPDINLFIKSKVEPIYRLLNSFEETHGLLKLKVFHLFDDKNNSYSHVSFMCVRGIWIRREYTNEVSESRNLIDLI